MDPVDKQNLERENLLLVILLIIAVILLIGVLIGGAPASGEVGGNPHVTLKVLQTTNQGDVVASPFISPDFDLQTMGEFSPQKGAQKGDILNCDVHDVVREFGDHGDHVLGFDCTNSDPKNPAKYSLRLTGLAFEKN